MTEEKNWTEHDGYFLELVNWLGKSCWVQMGKVEDPITKEKRVNPKEAEISLGMLKMLKEKTRGNLEKDLTEILNNTISKLQSAFDELKAGEIKE